MLSFSHISGLFGDYDYLSIHADLVFLIYLYQRWIYKVDKTRVNEFGFAGEDDKVSDGTETDALISKEDKKTN